MSQRVATNPHNRIFLRGASNVLEYSHTKAEKKARAARSVEHRTQDDPTKHHFVRGILFLLSFGGVV